MLEWARKEQKRMLFLKTQFRKVELNSFNTFTLCFTYKNSIFIVLFLESVSHFMSEWASKKERNVLFKDTILKSRAEFIWHFNSLFQLQKHNFIVLFSRIQMWLPDRVNQQGTKKKIKDTISKSRAEFIRHFTSLFPIQKQHFHCPFS